MGPNNSTPSFSIIIPVYGCVGCLKELCTRLTKTMDTITNKYEIIFVDDRSPDHAWDSIVKLQEQYSQIVGIRLSRNFGQHIAISAGLAESKGDFAIVLDCDLQDPPEIITELYDKIKEGYDLVLARRIEGGHSSFRLIAAKTYFWIMRYFTKERIDGRYGSFSILSRKVINSFLEFNESERHYLFIVRWLGYEVASVDYKHEERSIGKSSYSFRALLSHALDGIFFQSTIFLRWIIALGITFSIFGIGLASYFIYQYFLYGSVAGWTSVVVLILVCTGVLLSSMGVIGLYVGKIFNQTKDRPLYFIDTVSERNSQW